jgi:hypothetical protein
MSADLLREAAEVLRERIDGSQPSPWYAELSILAPDDANWWFVCDANGFEVAQTRHSVKAEAAYIATMHPGVGLALADWLDEIAAGWMWDDEGAACDWDGMPLKLDEAVDSHAVKVARLILGGAS